MVRLLSVSTRGWNALPARCSQGLWRRARRGWNWVKEARHGNVETWADAFALGAFNHAASVDAATWERWRATLAYLGYDRPPSEMEGPPPSLARTESLHARLESLRRRVQLVFERDLQSLPARIDDTDPRCRAVLEWAADLADSATIAELGCGSGRMLRVLKRRFPHCKLLGLDVAAESLQQVDASMARIRGGMLRLPFTNDSFAAVFLVESLEHSLRPRQAVEEALRVLRPGGRILLIDKHRTWQARCIHEPWERWFTLEEVTDWLSLHAEVERAEFLPAGGRDVPAGLFCLWTATKRMAGLAHE